MNRDELRRLAIRLAKHLRYHQSSPEEDYCMECEMINRRGQSRHGADCPIAELEAEEARSKLRPVEPKRNPDDCEPGFIRTTCVSTSHEARPYNPNKTAGEFEGEY